MTYFQEATSSIKNYKLTENAFLPRVVNIPLTQEINYTCKPLVKEGETVKEGQVIAETTDSKKEYTSYIHSSIPGTVTGISTSDTPDGKKDFSIQIKLDGEFKYTGKKLEKNSVQTLKREDIISILEKNGTINTFDITRPENLGLQIKNFTGKNLIVRMFDEDPSRITDSLITKFCLEEIIEGAVSLFKALSLQNIVFVTDSTSQEEITQQIEAKKISKAVVMQIPGSKYPSAFAKNIILKFNKKHNQNYKILKQDLFLDCSTVLEVSNSLLFNVPSISKYVHFSGNCLKASCLLNVKIGTTINDIIQQIGGLIKEPKLIVINGDFRGNSVKSLNVPVTKYVKSVSIQSKLRKSNDYIYSCINCGNCRFVCPAKISPDIIYNNVVNFNQIPDIYAKTSKLCIECGLCNTVCPARLPLSQTIISLNEKGIKHE